MRQRWYLRGLFAAIVGLGVVAGLARAGSQTLTPSPVVVNPAPIVQSMPGEPIVQAVPAGPSAYSAPYADSGVAYGPDYSEGGGCATCGAGLGHGWLHRPHLFKHVATFVGGAAECNCYANKDCLGCGSLQADAHFVFGSCRDFFGEPCLQGPIPPPMPQSYGQGPGGPGMQQYPGRPAVAPYPGAPGYGLQVPAKMPGGSSSTTTTGPVVVAPVDPANVQPRVEAVPVAPAASVNAAPPTSYSFQAGGYR